MFSKSWRVHAPLKTRLVKQRQMMSLMEKEMVIATGDLVFDNENWVKMWVDTGHGIIGDDGTSVAYRGIDLNAQLLWLVRRPKLSHGYHSTATSPFDAISEARTAWAERARVRSRWPMVRQIARDLLTGKQNFDVTREDARKSALCGVGIDAFMTRLLMPDKQVISGRMAASLMVIEPQLGFVINTAYERALTEGKALAPDAAQALQPV